MLLLYILQDECFQLIFHGRSLSSFDVFVFKLPGPHGHSFRLGSRSTGQIFGGPMQEIQSLIENVLAVLMAPPKFAALPTTREIRSQFRFFQASATWGVKAVIPTKTTAHHQCALQPGPPTMRLEKRSNPLSPAAFINLRQPCRRWLNRISTAKKDDQKNQK